MLHFVGFLEDYLYVKKYPSFLSNLLSDGESMVQHYCHVSTIYIHRLFIASFHLKYYNKTLGKVLFC